MIPKSRQYHRPKLQYHIYDIIYHHNIIYYNMILLILEGIVSCYYGIILYYHSLRQGSYHNLWYCGALYDIISKPITSESCIKSLPSNWSWQSHSLSDGSGNIIIIAAPVPRWRSGEGRANRGGQCHWYGGHDAKGRVPGRQSSVEQQHNERRQARA